MENSNCIQIITVVFDMLAFSNALKNHPHETIVKVKGLVSIIPLVGADKINIEENSFVFIKPITTTLVGDIDKQKRTIAMLEQLKKVVSRTLERWPNAKDIFDDDGEMFLSNCEAMAIGII